MSPDGIAVLGPIGRPTSRRLGGRVAASTRLALREDDSAGPKHSSVNSIQLAIASGSARRDHVSRVTR